MTVMNFVVGEIATELLKHAIQVSAEVLQCKDTADNIIELIKNIQPTIMEIESGDVELPAHRLAQIRMISKTLKKGKKLTEEVRNFSRWNVVRQVPLVKKMKKLEKRLASFFKCSILTNILADIHHLRANSEVRLDRVGKSLDKVNEQLGSMKTEEENKRADAMKKPVVIDFASCRYDGMKIYVVGLEQGKCQVKKVLFEGQGGVLGITGTAGIGKTTLARAIERDDEVRCHFGDQILFQTVSQNPKFEEIKTRMSSFFSGYEAVNPYYNLRNSGLISPKLVILDDVRTREALNHLTPFEIPNCTTLAVSRFELTEPESTYAMELLNEDDAVSLLCHSAFGQESVPYGFCGNLVKQVASECKGLPLTLKTTGASLRGKPETDWEEALQKLSRSETF